MQATATPFISYSGNREDVLLNRLFGTRDNGFFVDVGAGHPVIGNDTKALSDRGWTGINIEPQIGLYRELAAQRPRDRNLNIAVSDQPGTITPRETADIEMSTRDPGAARRIEARTLRQILEQAAPPRIDLLRIDAAGAEPGVLASSDWHRFRPLLVVVDATDPNATTVRRPGPGTSLLEAQGYRHVHFDGLNDYYAEMTHDVPTGVFDHPVNALDNFVPYGEVVLERARDALAREVALLTAERDAALRRVDGHASLTAERTKALEIDLQRANQEIVGLRRQISEKVAAGYVIPATRPADQMAREIAALYASTSWRITRPLRALARPRRTLRILLGLGVR